MTVYKHFALDNDQDGVVWLAIDVAGKSVNVMASEVMEELAQITAELTANPPAGLVMFSRKERGFIFGADINEFASFVDAAAVTAHIDYILNSFQQIEDLPCVTVILIDGICLGGGYEMALAFDYIIGIDNSSCQVGFPEINLGLLPGYGGSGRAYARMGLEMALKMVLHGKPVRAKDALSIGALDHLVVNREALADAARTAIAGGIERTPAAKCADPEALIAAERAGVAGRTRPRKHTGPLCHSGSLFI